MALKLVLCFLLGLSAIGSYVLVPKEYENHTDFRAMLIACNLSATNRFSRVETLYRKERPHYHEHFFFHHTLVTLMTVANFFTGYQTRFQGENFVYACAEWLFMSPYLNRSKSYLDFLDPYYGVNATEIGSPENFTLFELVAEE